jgi:anaerobic ribonucleoside-triphosphate reductase activating protein
MIQYADIVYDTIVDGIGLRNTLYVSGCPHHCIGCHNAPLQDYNYGKQDHYDHLVKLLTQSDNDITISGGEPFEQASMLWMMIHEIDYSDYYHNYAKRNYWIYSGYTFEQIIADPIKKQLLELCDVLVDGKFEIDKRDITLKFRGSSNQRLIDVKKSLKENKVIELER